LVKRYRARCSGTISWSIAYISSYGQNSILDDYTTFSPSSGTLTGSSEDAYIHVSIDTNSLSPGTTYHGGLRVDGTGGLVDYYYFTFTVISTFTPITVSGHKYIFGTNTGLSGWNILLYDSTGATLLLHVLPMEVYIFFHYQCSGSYQIKEILKAGWTAMTPTFAIGSPPAPQKFWVTQLQQLVGSIKLIRISPTSNGLLSQERRPSMVALVCQDGRSRLVGSSTYSDDTDGSGDFTIIIKEPGTYDIKEVLKGGWTMTYPSLYIGSGSDEDVTGYGSVTVGSGDVITGKDFTNFEWATVSGTKTEYGGSGLSGWTIKAVDLPHIQMTQMDLAISQ